MRENPGAALTSDEQPTNSVWMDQVSAADTRYTVAASSLSGLLAYARRLGIDADAMRDTLGLSAAQLANPEARVTQALNHRAWALVAAASHDDDFGLHMGEHMNLDAFHVLGHLAVRSETFGAAIETICHYSRILHDAGRIEMERDGDEVRVYPGCRGLVHDWPRHIAEYAAASVLALASVTTNIPLQPTRVGFKHARPASLREHVRVFGVTPVFAEPDTYVAFHADALKRPIVRAEAGVSTFLEAYARELVDKLPAAAPDFVTRVREIVLHDVKGASLTSVARALATTVRTLQRRLADADTSFQDVLDEARRALAERYVQDGSMALAEIGFLLGFADPSNFHRAFKRWTGQTPAAFRAQVA